MDRPEANPKELVWRLCGAGAAPFAVASAYLSITRFCSVGFTTLTDYAGLVVSVFAGALFLALLPIDRGLRVLLLVVYVPVVAVALFFYTFWFLGVFFHKAL